MAKNIPFAAREQRVSLFKDITGRIIEQLEKGRVPWVQPWGRPGVAAVGLPRNAITGRPYSGINVLVLWGETFRCGYFSQGWLTFRQAQEAGGMVRKGECGTSVVYADRFVPKENEGAGQESATGEPRAIPFLKRFTVFNLAQCDGLTRAAVADTEPLSLRDIVPVGEALIEASGVDLRIGGDKAFYCPGEDFVQVPPQPAFFEQVNYYRTCFHELCHATGHPARIGRALTGAFGSKDYAREELVAEIGSAYLCAALGIEPTVRHADYIGSWLEVLREDERAIFRAASAASKAAAWLLDRHEEDRDQRTWFARHMHQVGECRA